MFVDPNSPAGVEYALPLEKARREAAGSAGPGPDGTGPAGQPLFGVGIGHARSSSGATGPGGGTGSGGNFRSGDGRSEGPRSSDRRPSQADATRGGNSSAVVQSAGSGDSSGLIIGGIAAGVLAIGLALGFMLRWLLRSD